MKQPTNGHFSMDKAIMLNKKNYTGMLQTMSDYAGVSLLCLCSKLINCSSQDAHTNKTVLLIHPLERSA